MRMHAPKLALIARQLDDGAWQLASPAPGMFRAAVATGSYITPEDPVGTLAMLGRTLQLHVPAGVAGYITGKLLGAGALEYGAVIATLQPMAAAGTASIAATAQQSAQTAGLVFRAPTSGRFYGRAAPDKPPFVSAGDELASGATICLLEVMKTFHRVHYGGDALPERARVRDVLVKDGDDVNAGDPLLALDAL